MVVGHTVGDGLGQDRANTSSLNAQEFQEVVACLLFHFPQGAAEEGRQGGEEGEGRDSREVDEGEVGEGKGKERKERGRERGEERREGKMYSHQRGIFFEWVVVQV